MRGMLGCFIAFCMNFGMAYAAPPPVEAYAQLPAVRDAALSPNGHDLAVVVENEGQYIVRIFNLNDPSDKTVRASAIGKGVRPLWVKWVSNERLLLSVGATQDIRNTIVNTGFIYTMSADMKDVDILIKPERTSRENSRIGGNMSGARQFNNVVIDFLPDEPDYILMAFSDDAPLSPDVRKVDVRTGTYTKVRGGSGNIGWWISDRRGDVRVGQGRASIGNGYVLSIYDTHSNDWRSDKDYPGLDADDNVVGFTEDPNEMIVARYNGANTLGLFVYNLGKKAYTRKLFQHDSYDVSDIVLSADGKRVIGAEYIADATETVFFDETAKSHMETIRGALQGYTLRFIDQTPDGQKVILKAYAPDVPASLILYDFGTKSWINMGSDYPQLKGFEHAIVQPVKYTARDGESIPSYVTLPPKVLADGKIENVPFIIMPHGGPYARDTASFDYLAQFLASRGYGVLQMNFRGSEGYGRKFADAGRDSWLVMQTDVTDGAKWLIEKGYADKDRICIMGWSYGGYAALMGAVKHSDMYSCAVSIAGVTDLKALVDDMQKYVSGDKAARNFVKRGFESGSDMAENSPARRADEITIPVYLAHGTKDVNVHFDHFQRMKGELKKNRDVMAVELKDADHSVLDGENREKLFKTLDEFLREHLGESEYAP